MPAKAQEISFNRRLRWTSIGLHLRESDASSSFFISGGLTNPNQSHILRLDRVLTQAKQYPYKKRVKAMTDSLCIKVHNVNRSFGKQQVLFDINLAVPHSRILGLLGPSGSGKTTLIKLIAGIDEATGGEVFVLGEKMPKLSMLDKIGYMAQADALYGELTAEENLKFFALSSLLCASSLWLQT